MIYYYISYIIVFYDFILLYIITKHGQQGPRNATRSRETEKPRNNWTNRKAEKYETSREAEKPISREVRKYETNRKAEKPRSREAENGQAEKPRSRETQRMTRMK